MENRNIESLVSIAVAGAQAECGAPKKFLARRYGIAGTAVTREVQKGKRSKRWKAPAWSDEEHETLKRLIGKIGYPQIAAVLGRTVAAVRTEMQREKISPASKRTEWRTGRQTAELLGVDVHTVMLLIKRDLLKGYFLPMKRRIRVVHWMTLKRFVANTDNWIYFRTERVKDEELRRLIEGRKKTWRDRWLSVGQAARILGVDHRMVNTAIRKGKVRATDWGNWWIKESDLKGSGLKFNKSAAERDADTWPKEADEYLVLATAVGMTKERIGRNIGWDEKRVSYRFQKLCHSARLGRIISGAKLPIRRRGAIVFTDWKKVMKRFPSVRGAAQRFRMGKDGPKDRKLLAGVLNLWKVWFLGKIRGNRSLSRKSLAKCENGLREKGLDPLGRKMFRGKDGMEARRIAEQKRTAKRRAASRRARKWKPRTSRYSRR